jgi:hypothetical protein
MAPALKETEAETGSARLLILIFVWRDRIDGAVVTEVREVGANQGPRVEVEEADVPAKVGVAGAQAGPREASSSSAGGSAGRRRRGREGRRHRTASRCRRPEAA